MSDPELGPKVILQNREKVRGQIIKKLRSAINAVEKLAKAAPKKQRNKGRIPPKVRYYTLMGRLSESLELILRGQDTTEIAQRLKRLEQSIVALEADKSRNSDEQT